MVLLVGLVSWNCLSMDCIGCVGGVFAPLRWVVCHGDCQCVGAEVVAVGFLVDGFEKSLNFNFLPKSSPTTW